MSQYLRELDILISCLPNGKVWKAKEIGISRLYGFLKSFSFDQADIVDRLNRYSNGLNLYDATLEMIEYWERLVGIPDEIFSTNPNILSLDQRIKNIATELFGFKISRKSDLIVLLKKVFPELVNLEISIINPRQYSLPYRVPFFIFSREQVKNYIIILLPSSIITGDYIPYTVPFKVGGGNIINKIKTLVEYFIPFNKKCLVAISD